jgi:hypothetical protein
MSYLQDIDAMGTDNLGGVTELRVARTADIESMPEPVHGVMYGDITFKAGKGWALWKVTQTSARFAGQARNSQEHVWKDNSLAFVIAKDRVAVRRMLDLAQEDTLVALYKDGNGAVKVYGSLDEPVRFRYTAQSGAGPGQRNEYACELWSEGADNTWFYNGDIESAPAGTPPAIVRLGDGTLLATLAPGETFVITSGFTFGFRIE